MKKLILILALFALPAVALSQGTVIRTIGIQHNIADAYLSAADSIHDFGVIDFRQGYIFPDSLRIITEAGDSLKIRYYVVPVEDIGTETVADSVAGAQFTAGVSDGATQMTAGTILAVPWHNIVAAIGTHLSSSPKFHLYGRVYAVGSEVASSNKKFKVTVVPHY